MNVFGIGTLELLVILLVAFVALGPGKTIEVARTIGRVTREARRTFTDIMDAASLSDNDTSPRRDRSDTDRAGSDRTGTDRTGSDRAPDAPPQPPTDPLPMPSHLQENTGQSAERREHTEQPEQADSEPPTAQR